MSSIDVDKYQIVHIGLNEWEYDYFLDALMYYQYHEKPNDSKLKELIHNLNLSNYDLKMNLIK